MADQAHRSKAQLEAVLDEIRRSPATAGSVELIVRRPATDAREPLSEARLDTREGLVGDNWLQRGYRKSVDGSANPDMQLNVMNSRAAALIAGGRERWPLAGDQLYVDLDLSPANLPPGTRLAIGSAVIQVTAEPHTGCAKFVQRFGAEAMQFVNSPVGRSLNLRGINARVLQGGAIRVGDRVSKLPDPAAAD